MLKFMNSKNYPLLINIGLGLSFICLIISVRDLLNGNISPFLLSLVIICQLFGFRQFLESDYQEKNVINENINNKISFADAEKISRYQTEQVQLKLKRLIAKIESKSKENFYQLKQALIITKKQIENIREELVNKIDSFPNQSKTINISDIDDYLSDSFIKIFEEKFNYLQQKIEGQKSYFYYLVNRKYQAGMRQVQELLIPIYEKQNYLEELQQIRLQQNRVQIKQLQISLHQVTQQQNQDYLHLNQLILQPLKQKQVHLEDYQENMVRELEEKIENLQLSLTQVMLDYQESIWQLNQSIPSESNLSTSDTTNILSGQQDNQSQENYLNYYTNNPQVPNTLSSQVSSTTNLQQLNEIEAIIQREVENKSKQIETLLESFSLQQQNLDQLLEDKTKTYSQNFDVIYHNMNQINQLMISLESKYQSFTNINRKIHSRVKTAIAQLYNQEVKPIKTTLTNLVSDGDRLTQKQEELENLYHIVAVEFKTEINKVKDEIFTELGRINDILTAT